MSTRFTVQTCRGVVALTIVAGLTVGAVGCGGGGGEGKKPVRSTSASEEKDSNTSTQEGQVGEHLAELRGADGLILQVTSAQRDAGGFVTVNGLLKNDGAEGAVIPAALSGNETEIVRNGRSLGGATLVDAKSKKRYYVLRDTEGRPLTTTGFSTIKAGDSVSVFMQFPAPPADTTEVTLQLPTFASGTIQISG